MGDGQQFKAFALESDDRVYLFLGVHSIGSGRMEDIFNRLIDSRAQPAPADQPADFFSRNRLRVLAHRLVEIEADQQWSAIFPMVIHFSVFQIFNQVLRKMARMIIIRAVMVGSIQMARRGWFLSAASARFSNKNAAARMMTPNKTGESGR